MPKLRKQRGSIAHVHDAGIKGVMRLQRFMAMCGVASRRGCEELIREGRVIVNGKTAQIGQTVDPARDRIIFDSTRLGLPKAFLYLMMNKPKGLLCTAKDPEGRPTVYSLLPPLPAPLHSVGRLDFNSEGLLLFTNDGELTAALTHPSRGIERVYEVKIQGDLFDSVLSRINKGIRLEDGPVKLDCKFIRRAQTNTWWRVTLAEGRYREVRRIFSAIGVNVLKLKRVSFGPIVLGSLKPGATRELSALEIEALKRRSPRKLGPR